MTAHTPIRRRAFLQRAAASILAGTASAHFSKCARAEVGRSTTPSCRWRQTAGTVALARGDVVLWQHNHSREEGRPCFHPVNLPDGTPLTWLRPPDHVWHRALWFSWKHINGVNYWDPDPPPGKTAPRDVKVTLLDDWSARLSLQLDYRADDQPVLSEERQLQVTSPDDRGRYSIVWRSKFTAGQQDVHLERTPISGEKDGVDWGGYAGLSFRVAEELHEWQVINSEGQRDMTSHGKPARWMDFSGVTTDGKSGGAAIFDHPSNPRHPSPWFVSMDTRNHFGYFSPAFLFNANYVLLAGRTLMLSYAILLHPRRPVARELEAYWKSFAGNEPGIRTEK
jgi:hypothetical protein